MWAAWIFFFARTIRWASVASGTRNARAISGVVSPPSVRRVSATRASSGSAGWQHVKMSRSRSSATRLSPPSRTSPSTPAPAALSICATFAASVRRRRSRSSARFRAVVTIHAPGRSGTPSRGQRSIAVTNASWTTSSARSKSPRMRMRVASARPDSSRKVRSTTARGSAIVPVTRRRRRGGPWRSRARSGGGSRLGHRLDRTDLDRRRGGRRGSPLPPRAPRPGPRTRRGRTRRAPPSSPRTARR